MCSMTLRDGLFQLFSEMIVSFSHILLGKCHSETFPLSCHQSSSGVQNCFNTYSWERSNSSCKFGICTSVHGKLKQWSYGNKFGISNDFVFFPVAGHYYKICNNNIC